MKIKYLIPYIDTHTAGEGTRIVFPLFKFHTLLISPKLILNEPRGHAGMVLAILSEPQHVKADVAVSFWDAAGPLRMCIHGAMGVAKVLPLLLAENRVNFVLQCPAGLIACLIKPDNSIAVRNVPSFYVTTLQYKGISCDIAYAGNLFALVNVKQLNLQLNLKHLPRLIKEGLKLREILNAKYTFKYPGTGEKLKIGLIEFYSEDSDVNVVIFGNGQVDRSPCGTGTCARMAVLYARDILKTGDVVRSRSIFNTEFWGRIVDTTQIGPYSAIIPEISGEAFVINIGWLTLDNADPFCEGLEV